MNRKYKFEIVVKATAYCTVEAESPEVARDYFNQIDWKVKLDGVGPFDSIVDWQQSEFEAPNITLVDSEIREGEEVYYCPSHCEWKGDDKFYLRNGFELFGGRTTYVDKYGQIISHDVSNDFPIVKKAYLNRKRELQLILDEGKLDLVCRICLRKAKKNVY